MLIKVCGLKDNSNVEAILSEGSPDLMGMIFYEKSQRYIGTMPLSINPSIARHIPTVGVFVNASLQQIIKQQRAFGFTWIQLHGDEDLNFIKALKDALDIKIIKVFRVTDRIDEEELRPFETIVDYFLFDTQTSQYGGSGRQFDWNVLEEYNLTTPYILSGGIDIEHASEVISIYNKSPRMAGVDINSKFELKPGIKDPYKVARFINKVRENTNKAISYDRNR